VKTEYFDLNGKKGIVAGGAGDLGTAIVQGLHKAGVELVVMDHIDNVAEWANSITIPGQPMLSTIQVNLSDRSALKSAFEQALEVLGRLDILVNCQGIQRRYPAVEFPLNVWDEVIEINLTSVFELCQLAGREMLLQEHGKIVNLASMQSFNGGFTIPAYAASKAGVAILTKSLSNEWAGKGVTVNAIAPGYFDTKMTAGVKQDPIRYQHILARIPTGRWGDPEDIVGPLLFLCSPASDYVNGVVLPVDGGMLGM